MTFSKHLLRGTIGILAALCLVLFVLVASYFDRFAGRPYADVDIFVPLDRVERLTRLVSSLREPMSPGPQPAAKPSPMTEPGLLSRLSWFGAKGGAARPYSVSCPARQQDVLAGRLAGQFNLSRKEAAGRLAIAFTAWSEGGGKGCRAFFVDADLVMRSPFLLESNQSLSEQALEQSLSQILAERVAWDAKPPCLRIRSSDQKLVYLKGPAGYCLEEGMGLGSALAFGSSSRELVNFVYSRLFVSEAVRDVTLEARSLELTLHPVVQSVLDGYGDCLKDLIDCSWPSWPNASQHQTAIVVVMDPRGQQVLGMRCFGQCTPSSGFNSLVEGALAPLALPVPPASIAKLFYALAFSEMPSTRASERSELALQVKTSGQLDGRSLKRNEWWERLALCDLRARPDSGQTIECAMARRAQTLATELGWNQYCEKASDDCGRVRLSGVSSEVMGYAGYFRALPPIGSEGGSGASVLNWSSYNAIRDAGGITQIREPYFAASAAVQSVLGAGDNRVSALGLASLAGQIERMSRGMAPLNPALVVASTERSQQGLPLRQLRQQQAARQVREAMARVMIGPEPGWDGAGTGHSAFLASFQRACKAPCPIQGKTGTVSRQDRRFAGTTTFAAIVEVNRLTRQLGEAGGLLDAEASLASNERRAENKGLPPVITIGVITIPRQDQRPLPEGHGASRFGMQFTRDLISGGS